MDDMCMYTLVHAWKNKYIKFAMRDSRLVFSLTYRLHSFIFPVRSSNCLACLFESLILSIFWNPFLRKSTYHGIKLPIRTQEYLNRKAAKKSSRPWIRPKESKTMSFRIYTIIYVPTLQRKRDPSLGHIKKVNTLILASWISQKNWISNTDLRDQY